MEPLNSKLLYFIKLDCLLPAPAASVGEKERVCFCRLLTTVICSYSAIKIRAPPKINQLDINICLFVNKLDRYCYFSGYWSSFIQKSATSPETKTASANIINNLYMFMKYNNNFKEKANAIYSVSVAIV